MSTRVGVICEGPIDVALLSALLERIAKDRAEYTWPVASDDLEVLRVRKTGHGGVVAKLRRLVETLESGVRPDCAFFVVVLDSKKTRGAQDSVRHLVSGRSHEIVYGLAVKEIEAWWLADRRALLEWLDLTEEDISSCAYAAEGYRPEADDRPKTTLGELTALSDRCDRNYGQGDAGLAGDFAEDWRDCANIQVIEHNCARGFAPFSNDVAAAFERCLRDDATGRGALPL